MKTSPELDKIAPALVKARLAMPPVHKDADNPFFGNSYASLGAINAAALPTLLANGIFVSQGGDKMDDTGMEIVTRLTHESGQWIESSLRLPLLGHKIKGGGYEPVSPQSAGSAFSYGRRYGLAAILGIVADEDDDGEAASPKSAPVDKRQSAPSRPPAPRQPSTTPPGIPSACPKCGKGVFDNREKKKKGDFKATSPDWTCRDKECKTDGFRTAGWVKEGDDATEAANDRFVGPGMDQEVPDPEDDQPW